MNSELYELIPQYEIKEKSVQGLVNRYTNI